MTGRAIRSLAGWLCAALTFTTLLVVLGRSDDRVFPSITSSKPSGTRLLSEVLAVNGIEVRQDRARIPTVEPNDMLVAFIPERDNSEYDMEFVDTLLNRAKKGSRVVLVYLEPSMRTGTLAATEPITVGHAFRPDAPLLKLSASQRSLPNTVSKFTPFEDYCPTNQIGVWQKDGVPLVSYSSVGQGTVVEVSDGIGMTNRFIDRYDNAAFAVQILGPLVPKGGQLVFAEAGFGNASEDSLISAIGGWARSALWQGLLLLTVIGWTLGTMFGVPERHRSRQAGTRDLMDAFANLLRRSKKRPVAVETILNTLERDLRRAVNLPPTASQQQLTARLPKPLSDPLTALRMSDSPSVGQLDALRRQVHEFIGTRNISRTEVD